MKPELSAPLGKAKKETDFYYTTALKWGICASVMSRSIEVKVRLKARLSESLVFKIVR